MGGPPSQGGRARQTGYITWKIVAKTCTFRNLQIVERYWVFLDARSISHRQERFMKRRGINISGCVVLPGPLPAISGPWLAFVTAEEVTSCPPPGWSGPGCLFERTSLTSRTWHWHKSWQGQWQRWQNTSAYCSLELPWQETCSVYKRTIEAQTRKTIGVTEGNILSHCWITNHKWWWLVVDMMSAKCHRLTDNKANFHVD